MPELDFFDSLARYVRNGQGIIFEIRHYRITTSSENRYLQVSTVVDHGIKHIKCPHSSKVLPIIAIVEDGFYNF